MTRWRAGQLPRQNTIARIVIALRRILGRAVAATEVFYLGEAADDGTPEARRVLGIAA